jgi:hypothetical protein
MSLYPRRFESSSVALVLQTVCYEPVLKGSDAYVLQLVVLSFCTFSIVLVFSTEHSILEIGSVCVMGKLHIHMDSN